MMEVILNEFIPRHECHFGVAFGYNVKLRNVCSTTYRQLNQMLILIL